MPLHEFPMSNTECPTAEGFGNWTFPDRHWTFAFAVTGRTGVSSQTWEPVRELRGAAFRAPRGQMLGAGPQAMSMYIVEARQQRRCPRTVALAALLAGTRRAHGCCGRSLRCSSSTMCLDIASSSRLELASQAPCARSLLILGQAPRPEAAAKRRAKSRRDSSSRLRLECLSAGSAGRNRLFRRRD
jgi:hypothetical protein